jgi:hypothetical protein
MTMCLGKCVSAATALAIGVALCCSSSSGAEEANDPWPLLREEFAASVAGGPVLSAWLDFLHRGDNALGGVEFEAVSGWPAHPSAKHARLYAGDSVCGMLAERDGDDYVTVYDMSEPGVRMLGERHVDMPTPLPLEGLVLQEAERLVVLSPRRSATIGYPDVKLSAITTPEADELGRRRLLKVWWSTEGGEVFAVDVAGEAAVSVPFAQLPGGATIRRDPHGFWEGGSGDIVFTSEGGRLGYLVPQDDRSLRLVVIDMASGDGRPSWRQSLGIDLTPVHLALPDPLSPRGAPTGRVWLSEGQLAAVVSLHTTYWPPTEGADTNRAGQSRELREHLWSRQTIAVTPARTATLALVVDYMAGDLHLAWRWTGTCWEAVPNPRRDWERSAWILGNGRVVFHLGDALWVTERGVAR